MRDSFRCFGTVRPVRYASNHILEYVYTFGLALKQINCCYEKVNV